MTLQDWILVLTGFLGTVPFALLFHMRGPRLVVTCGGGFLSGLLLVLLNHLIPSEAVNYLIVSVAVSLYAELMARLLKTPATPIETTALVPLIPGSSLYYTMLAAVEGNLELFFQRALNTLKLTASMVLGIILVAGLSHILFKGLQKKKKRNRNKGETY